MPSSVEVPIKGDIDFWFHNGFAVARISLLGGPHAWDNPPKMIEHTQGLLEVLKLSIEQGDCREFSTPQVFLHGTQIASFSIDEMVSHVVVA